MFDTVLIDDENYYRNKCNDDHLYVCNNIRISRKNVTDPLVARPCMELTTGKMNDVELDETKYDSE